MPPPGAAGPVVGGALNSSTEACSWRSSPRYQTYCRGLHDEAIEVHVAHVNSRQADLLRSLMTRGRRLDGQTPRVSVIGSDFVRLGLSVVDDLKASGPAVTRSLALLDVLVDFRNAIVHGNETQITAIVATGDIAPTLSSYRAYRRTANRLAGTMDQVVAVGLASLLNIPPPW